MISRSSPFIRPVKIKMTSIVQVRHICQGCPIYKCSRIPRIPYQPTYSSMRGVLYRGPGKLSFSDKIDVPKINHPDEVLVKISYCGICGTDLLCYKTETNFFKKLDPKTGHPLSGLNYPVVMGHEFSGTIVEVGANVAKSGEVKVGDHIVCEPTCYCRDKPRWPNSVVAKSGKDINSLCEACEMGLTNLCEEMGITGLGCANGGLAEYVVISAHHAVKVPDFIPLEIAALVQPLAVSYHAFRTLGFKKGSSVLIVGCGSIGIGCILAAQAFEAGSIVCSEPAEIRRMQAKNLGVDATFNPLGAGELDAIVDQLKKLSPEGRGFDYAFDCSGFPITFDTGLQSLKFRGKLVNLAIWPDNRPMTDFYPMDFTSGEKTITGSMCYTIEDFEGVIKAMTENKISLDNCKKLITKKVMLEDAVQGGFEELLQHKDKHMKILITPKKLVDGKEVDEAA